MTEFQAGDTVGIRSGPFASFFGKVEEVFYETSTLKVKVEIFGRRTPVSLTFDDVERAAPGDAPETFLPSNN